MIIMRDMVLEDGRIILNFTTRSIRLSVVRPMEPAVVYKDCLFPSVSQKVHCLPTPVRGSAINQPFTLFQFHIHRGFAAPINLIRKHIIAANHSFGDFCEIIALGKEFPTMQDRRPIIGLGSVGYIDGVPYSPFLNRFDDLDREGNRIGRPRHLGMRSLEMPCGSTCDFLAKPL